MQRWTSRPAFSVDLLIGWKVKVIVYHFCNVEESNKGKSGVTNVHRKETERNTVGDEGGGEKEKRRK